MMENPIKSIFNIDDYIEYSPNFEAALMALINFKDENGLATGMSAFSDIHVNRADVSRFIREIGDAYSRGDEYLKEFRK